MGAGRQSNEIVCCTIQKNVLKITNTKKYNMKLEERRYTLNELSAILREEKSHQEFNPVMFNNDNKKNNKEAVETMMKEAEKLYDGKVSEKKENSSDNIDTDINKTTLDARFSIKPGKEWVERVEAQAEGYDSSLQKENHKGKETEDEKDTRKSGKEFYEKRKNISKEMTKKGEDVVTAGLKTKEIAAKQPEVYKTKTAFGEGKVSKRLRFKNTVFLSEDRIRTLIPEEYKTSGNKFYMTDATDTDYLVECRQDEAFGYITIGIHKCEKEEEINEELDRMKKLAAYNSRDYNKPNRKDTLRSDISKVKGLEKG